jgi:hypothetical protein
MKAISHCDTTCLRSKYKMEGNEKAYTSMGFAGIVDIVFGIIVTVVGVIAGTFVIVSGAKLLKDRKSVTF